MALPAAAIVSLVAFSLVGEVEADTLIALAVSGSAAAFVSPIQDHLRALLHLSGKSWIAALVSSVQFGGIVAGLVLIRTVDHAWTPFGALALANVLSTSAGLLAARFLKEKGVRPPKRELFSIGRWLLIMGLAASGASFIASALVEALAGPAALGYVEGARVVARPLQVFGMGLLAVLGPRSMEAAVSSDQHAARRLRRAFAMFTLLVGLPYALFVTVQWSWNPLVALLPDAYFVEGFDPAVLMPCSDRWSNAVAGLPPEMKQRFPASVSTGPAVEILTDKDQLRKCLEKLGIPGPRTIPVDNPVRSVHHSGD